MIEAETRELFSRPVQASVEVPMDTFKVCEKHGPSIQIRLDGEEVSVFISAHGRSSYLKDKTLPYEEFVRIVGEAVFGPDWDKESVRK